MINFLLRKPKFPAIMDTGEELIGAMNWNEFKKRLNNSTFANKDAKHVIDSTAEGFAFHPDLMVVSPFTLKRRWTKAQIIDLYNKYRKQGAPEYPAKSLGNKSVERIINEVVELLSKP